MEKDSQVIMIGEDLLDPYGGAFKVSKGLSTKYPNQVISTPVSEQAITGAAIGMAMRGMKPIVEIMFGDFITLCMDQLVNHATKYHWMFNQQVNVPLTIRTPMGGGRGYGPTHSQSLESMCLSVSGLRIVAPSIFHNPGDMLEKCVLNIPHPILFIENKTAYPKQLHLEDKYNSFSIARNNYTDGLPDIYLSLFPQEQAKILIVTYGGLTEIACEAVKELFIEEEILVDIYVCGQIRPFNIELISRKAKNVGRILILEEGNQIGGWGAEVASVISEEIFDFLSQAICRVGAADYPIPSARSLEKEMIPTKNTIKDRLKMLAT